MMSSLRGLKRQRWSQPPAYCSRKPLTSLQARPTVPRHVNAQKTCPVRCYGTYQGVLISASCCAELQRRCRFVDTTVADRATNSRQSAVELSICEIPEVCQILCRDESYELVIAVEGIRIAAESPAGVFYGIQTLLQLLPWSADVPDSYPVLHGCRIVDYPRFKWYVFLSVQPTKA